MQNIQTLNFDICFTPIYNSLREECCYLLLQTSISRLVVIKRFKLSTPTYIITINKQLIIDSKRFIIDSNDLQISMIYQKEGCKGRICIII